MRSKKKISILVTAGPTREYIDPVRYISNDSSGKMGFAIADAAAKLGFNVTLVAGPVNLKTPRGVRRIDVVSANEMYKAVLKNSKKSDAIVMAAAIADFSPVRFSKNKIKKENDRTTFQLNLKKTSDILKEICKRRRHGQKIVGFALETKDLLKNARKKLASKKCDLIVANSSCAIGSDLSEITIVTASGHFAKFPALSKTKSAKIILSYIL